MLPETFHEAPYTSSNKFKKDSIDGWNQMHHRVAEEDSFATITNNVHKSESRESGLALAQAKFDSFKSWSISTYKCTRQALQEKLGKTNRTVDLELEQNVDGLKDMQAKYNNILVLSRSLAAHLAHALKNQHQLSECFADMASKEADLREEFTFNATAQKLVAQNGERLLTAINFFISSLSTLCDKTIEDTMLTIKSFEICRLEYDANRNDVEQFQCQQQQLNLQNKPVAVDLQQRLHETQASCQLLKSKYEQLREDVQVKLSLLHENRLKVMKKQLLLFHNATVAFFSGNQSSLEAALKQFSVNPNNSTNHLSAWLES